MTKCAGVKKTDCKKPCVWVQSKGCRNEAKVALLKEVLEEKKEAVKAVEKVDKEAKKAAAEAKKAAAEKKKAEAAAKKAEKKAAAEAKKAAAEKKKADAAAKKAEAEKKKAEKKAAAEAKKADAAAKKAEKKLKEKKEAVAEVKKVDAEVKKVEEKVKKAKKEKPAAAASPKVAPGQVEILDQMDGLPKPFKWTVNDFPEYGGMPCGGIREMFKKYADKQAKIKGRRFAPLFYSVPRDLFFFLYSRKDKATNLNDYYTVEFSFKNGKIVPGKERLIMEKQPLYAMKRVERVGWWDPKKKWILDCKHFYASFGTIYGTSYVVSPYGNSSSW